MGRSIACCNRATATYASSSTIPTSSHGAHGYLISQFLSPLANLRDDDGGGDLDRRMRFPVEVLRAVRAAVGNGFAVGIKLNSADFQRGGFTEDESEQVVARLSGERIDLIEISGGTFEQPAMMGSVARQSTRDREAYFLSYAERVRVHAGTVPLVASAAENRPSRATFG